MRNYSLLDRIVTATDKLLPRTLRPTAANNPAREGSSAEDAMLSAAERRHSAALMRINHAGEVAAQGLYTGQALLARSAQVRELLRASAREETDHLELCSRRLSQLGDRQSYLTPLWWLGSVTIGALAALPGDRVSLGFVAETERQVEAHLNGHLERLPPHDQRSREALMQMRNDETAHGAKAQRAGGIELPGVVRLTMRAGARVMTETAYWV